MFEGKKYTTSGVMAEIPEYLQNILWFMILNMQVEKKDYLQVFELSETIRDGKKMQTIVHTQEQPHYRQEQTIPLQCPVNARVFVIDDYSHSTMLLASEY